MVLDIPAPTEAPWLLLRLTRIGGAVHVPRGHLESRIEAAAPDRIRASYMMRADDPAPGGRLPSEAALERDWLARDDRRPRLGALVDDFRKGRELEIPVNILDSHQLPELVDFVKPCS